MLSKDEILKRTSNGLDVFKYYISGQWRVGRNFLNPLYEDKRASCNIYFDRRCGSYRIKDFGNDDFSGDCFFFVGKLKNLDCRNAKGFVEILQIINHDLSLNLDNPDYDFVPTIPKTLPKQEPVPEQKKNKPYNIIQQKFSPKELSFWQQYGIMEETLKTYKVISLKIFSSENKEGNPFFFTSSEQEPIFGYTGKRHIKIYRPFSEIRFLYGGNLGDNYCFGLEQLPAKGDTLFLTGGEKDVLSLTAHGFYAICFNSETSNIQPSLIRKLSYRFKHIILLYDVDKTGLESSLKHQQQLADLGLKRFVLPLSGDKSDKDISDYFKNGNSRENFIQLFLEFLDTLYNETMAILKPCEIDFNNPPIKAEMIISINDVPLGTQGNLFGITGGEGTGKSNYVGSLIAGTIREADITIDTLGTDVNPNKSEKAVLLYDTEQSETQLYKNISNILKRSKQNTMPEYFKAYCLTSMSRKERLQAIVQSMDKFYYQYGGIQLVVIDGIADLIRCANDEAESIAVIDELYRLAGIYKTCILCVLHFIPNGMKLRGHLGSELQRKAAAILSIERDEAPQISVVKALKVRDGSPLDVPLVQFSWNKEISMHTYIGEKPKEEKEKRKETELTGVARTIFGKQKYCTYVDLCEQLQTILDVKERTAKSYIKFMRDKEIILKDPSNVSYFIIGHIQN
jgi:DNA primase (bacterial type)